MKSHLVYLIDENDEQRRAFSLVLNELFKGSGLLIEGRVPLPKPQDYAAVIASGDVSALILDQKMEDGGVAYSGTQLSGFLRGIVPKLPIYILSNYTDDYALFEDGEGYVEDLISKRSVTDPTSKEAQIFKARFLRRIGGFVDVVEQRAARYHDLLVKSLRETLSPDELAEMGILESERAIPQQAMELRDIHDLSAAIEELRKRIKSGS